MKRIASWCLLLLSLGLPSFATAAEPRPLRVFDGHIGEVSRAIFSPDGRLLATASSRHGDRSIRLWDSATGELKARLQEQDDVDELAFSPDGKTLAAGGSSQPRRGRAHCTVTLWDVATSQKRRILTEEGLDGVLTGLCYSPDGEEVAALFDRSVGIWDTTTGRALREFRIQDGGVDLVYSPREEMIATSSWTNRDIVLWDASTGRAIRFLKGHTRGVDSLAFSPNGKLLASGSSDNTVKLWYLTTGEVLKTFKGLKGAVDYVAFSPDGRLLAAGCRDGTATLWDTGSFETRAKFKAHAGPVRSAVFSPDGKRLATAGGLRDRTAKTWDVAELLACGVAIGDSSGGGARGPGKGKDRLVGPESKGSHGHPAPAGGGTR